MKSWFITYEIHVKYALIFLVPPLSSPLNGNQIVQLQTERIDFARRKSVSWLVFSLEFSMGVANNFIWLWVSSGCILVIFYNHSSQDCKSLLASFYLPDDGIRIGSYVPFYAIITGVVCLVDACAILLLLSLFYSLFLKIPSQSNVNLTSSSPPSSLIAVIFCFLLILNFKQFYSHFFVCM